MSWMSLGGSSFENGNNVSHRQLIPHCSPSLVQGKNNACHFFRSHISRYDVFKIKSCSIYQRRNRGEKKCPPKNCNPCLPQGDSCPPAPNKWGRASPIMGTFCVCVFAVRVWWGEEARCVHRRCPSPSSSSSSRISSFKRTIISFSLYPPPPAAAPFLLLLLSLHLSSPSRSAPRS